MKVFTWGGNLSFTATRKQSRKNMISVRISDNIPPQMKNLNMVIPPQMKNLNMVIPIL